MELFKDIAGYEGLYQISNLARVKSLKKEWIGGKGAVRKLNEMILRQHVNPSGYYVLGLSKSGVQKHFLAHRLMATAFIPNPESKETVNHIDGNKLNNALENIEWCTVKENIQHAWENRLVVGKKGEKHGMSKLTEIQVLNIRSEYKRGKNQPELSRNYNVSQSNISEIVLLKSWTHI